MSCTTNIYIYIFIEKDRAATEKEDIHYNSIHYLTFYLQSSLKLQITLE